MSTRATKAEVTARIETVFELRMGGAGFSDIREWAIAPKDREGKPLPPWDVSDSQIWRYIHAADKLCKERYDAKADHLLNRHLLRRERLYAHCLEVGDYKGALAVLKDSAELEGHYKRDNDSNTLEAFLASLPPELAKATRTALAEMLSAGGAASGGESDSCGDTPGSREDLRACGDGTGPVADEGDAVESTEDFA